MKNIAIIIAAGSSTRLKHQTPKQYLCIDGQALLTRVVSTFLSVPSIDNILVVIREKDKKLYYDAVKKFNILAPVIGGMTRTESVFLGLKALKAINPLNVLIHDAARPLVSARLINDVILHLQHYSAVDVGININDTVKQNNKLNKIKVIDRSKLYATQTPQGFRYKIISSLHEQNRYNHTDDISLCIKNNIKVYKVNGDRNNIKITQPSDIEFYKYILNTENIYRTGIGIDIHKFSLPLEKNVKIKVCGISITHNQCIIAHSDGDVGFHAITEALLGSIALGNIGELFPSENMRYKNIDSAFFLQYAKDQLKKLDARVVNIDLTIVCQEPKIMQYSRAMRGNIASILEIDINQVSVKATTTEKLGFLGNQKGIAAQAVCSVMCKSTY